MPLKRIWRASRLERPAAQHLCAGLRHGLGSRKNLLSRFHRTRPRHHHNLVPAHVDPVGQLDDRSLWSKTPPRQFVRRTDAMNFLHPRQQLEIANIKINPRPDRSQHGHPRPRRAVHFKSDLHQVLDHLLNQLLVRAFLHRHNHKNLSIEFGLKLLALKDVLVFPKSLGIPSEVEEPASPLPATPQSFTSESNSVPASAASGLDTISSFCTFRITSIMRS